MSVQHPELTVPTMTFDEACVVAGINCIERDDGFHVDCCGEPCTIGSGIFGGDVASCEKCGASVRNLASPHINMGHISDRLIEDGVYETCWFPSEQHALAPDAPRDNT